MGSNFFSELGQHRRIVGAGDQVFYGDLTLRSTADAHAWHELSTAVRRAIDAQVGEEEILDALLSGDPCLVVLACGPVASG
ncbi:MAG: hypothetical protein M3Y09_15335 [Actinomycetota bacterium]|nr:hypothetical protein [Actinomycetota bacterium]